MGLSKKRRKPTPDQEPWMSNINVSESSAVKCYTKYRSVPLHSDHLQLSLTAPKTDKFRVGVTSVKIPLARCPSPQNGLLFDFGRATPFTRQLVTKTLRSCLRTLGYTGNYLVHSFRREVATSAREAGLTDDETRLLRR